MWKLALSSVLPLQMCGHASAQAGSAFLHTPMPPASSRRYVEDLCILTRDRCAHLRSPHLAQQLRGGFGTSVHGPCGNRSDSARM